MESFITIIQSIVAGLGCLVALSSIILFVKLHWPAPGLWFFKLYVSALSPFLALSGLIATAVGILTGSIFITVIGVFDILVFGLYIFRVTRPPARKSNFEKAFGMNWGDHIDPDLKKNFLPSRNTWRLPPSPEARLQQDIIYATVPGTNRQLLCDIWQPGPSIKNSGLAFIYMHGSAFYFLDKDFSTRPLFRHLAAQGHVIMDVAYRLAPETDLMGMVNDVTRAVVWMKENAKNFQIDPARIVLGGGSAGGHLAMLAAYTINDQRFIPADLKGKDISVRGVISLYGSNDLEAVYYHTNQHLTTRSLNGKPQKKVPTKMPKWIKNKIGRDFHRLGMDKGFENAGALAPLLGGHPDECPENYALYSPINYVREGCPPTLLIHDAHDIMAPVKTTKSLYRRLAKTNNKTILHIIPQTDHAFDLILPGISPAAHNAIYDVERFLGLMASLN